MYVFSTCVGSHTSSQNHRVLLAGSSFSGAHAHICVITHGVCKPLQILACVCECMCTSMSPAAALHRHPRVRQRRRQEEGEDHARGRTGAWQGRRGRGRASEGATSAICSYADRHVTPRRSIGYVDKALLKLRPLLTIRRGTIANCHASRHNLLHIKHRASIYLFRE
ncbi:unnamed protein product [Prorocentrum cordatum]|nr:unnamed protein product [Polarella glacialis]